MTQLSVCSKSFGGSLLSAAECESLSGPLLTSSHATPVCTDLYWSLLDWLQFLEFHAAVHLLPFESAPFASRYTALAIPWAESSFPLLILLFTAGVDVSVSLTGWVAG